MTRGTGDGTETPGAGRGWRLLGLTPGARVWRSRRWDHVMLLTGLGMLVTNALAAAGPSPLARLSWLSALVGLGLALLAASDLLADGGAGRAAVALRVLALLCSAVAVAGWGWAAARGSVVAGLALAFGGGCAALGVALWWARAKAAGDEDA